MLNSKNLWGGGIGLTAAVGATMLAVWHFSDPQSAAAFAALGTPQTPAHAQATVHPTVVRRSASSNVVAQRIEPAPTAPAKADVAAPKPVAAVANVTRVTADDAEMDGFDDEPATAPAASTTAVVRKQTPGDGFDDGAVAAASTPTPKPARSSGRSGITIAMLDAMKSLPGGINALPKLDVPLDNPMTEAKVELGRLLYFDTRLSGDLSMSCASCHNPTAGFSDGLERARGFGGKTLGRHSPTVLNAAYNNLQMWDGRFHSLEAQAKGPIMADVEMNMGSVDTLIQRLNADPHYPAMFQQVFGDGPSLERVAQAIAAFERTVITPDAPFDRYAAGDKNALNESQKRGLALFVGKASCVNCHSGVNFTDDKFHNLGLVKRGSPSTDEGRSAISKDEKDFGAFRTPTVRNATLTAPYMHDGSVATLPQLIDFYDRGGHNGDNKSPLIKPLGLTDAEKADLLAFIESLTGEQPDIKDPWREAQPIVAGVDVK